MNNGYFGLYPADILLPKSGFEKFAVIACDQYTSEPKYWQEVEKIVGGTPSAYNMILPEIYLDDGIDNRIEKINRTMSEYLTGGVFGLHGQSMIYVERTVADGRVRKGIVGKVDLEQYDYSKYSKSLIRATEQTVLERIPPRVKIRQNAPLELPHIMLLVDDPDMTVIEPQSRRKSDFELAYDFELMQNGGHIKGYFADTAAISEISAALKNLFDKSGGELLFAVGDGNHSLATAKECYNQSRSEKSRYALVEVVNIHDSAIEFEPIYRVVFGADKDDLIGYLTANAPAKYDGGDQHFECVFGEHSEHITLGANHALPVGTLQKLLDDYAAKHDGVKIDYIHGIGSVREICRKNGAVGFIFEGMQKNELMNAIKQDGSLPRKTFSMGHADDKRFYIEARKIR